MSRVRLYVDEDAEEYAVIQGLLARGLDVLTTSAEHRTGTTDAEQLAFAIELQRTLYSLNVADFACLRRERLKRGDSHFGIVVIPDQRCSIGEKIRRLAAFVNRVTAEEMIDRMEFL
jgi:hypothetical protein